MAVSTSINLTVRANETGTADLGTPSMAHLIDYARDLASGTSSGQADLIWSDTRSVVAATPDDLDIVGGITSTFGAAISAVKPVMILIKNNSTTTGQYLTVGNEGTNPFFAGYVGAAAHTRIVHPSGIDMWASPIDTATATAGTADKLRITSASGTISYSIVVLARSA